MQSRRAARTVLALMLGVGLTAFGRCGDPEPTWTLVWSDEFEGPAGQSPDPGLYVDLCQAELLKILRRRDHEEQADNRLLQGLRFRFGQRRIAREGGVS
jgi:hypothetical protein